MTRPQRTLAAIATVEGFGYWSGVDIQMEFHPAEENTGIVFVRNDLPGRPRIPALSAFCVDVPHRTALGQGSASVEMVEHALSALAGLGIDNCEIQLNAAELPGLDGSAFPFVEALLRAGFEVQEKPICPLIIEQKYRLEGNSERWISVEPHESNGLELSFTLDYERLASIGRQSATFVLSPEVFCREIAPCRTFVTEREANQILASGLAKRATYQDLLVFNEKGPIDNSLRFPDECVRHKILDLLGDLALTGRPIYGRIHGHCSGHDLNVPLVRELVRPLAYKIPG